MPDKDDPLLATQGAGAARRLPVFVARSLFVILSLAPLLGTAGWAAWRHVNLDATGYEDWLGARLGLEVELGALEHPTPNTERIAQASLLDPETGRLLAQADRIVVDTTPNGTHLHCESIFIPRSRLMALWQLLHDRALRERRLLAKPIHLSADQIVISSEAGQTELADWTLEINRREEGAFATSTFRERKPNAEPVEVFIYRQLIDDVWSTEIDLLTKSRVAAASLFGEPTWLSALGTQVGFHGHLWLQHTAHNWSADFAGTVDGLELERLVTDRFPHQLSGVATATIRQLEIVAGRIRRLEGKLYGSSGQVSASLLDAASEFLGMQASGHANLLTDYSELGLLFRIDHEGAVLRGACDVGGGAILASASGPLLVESPRQPKYTYQLIQALANIRGKDFIWTESCKPMLDMLPPPPTK